MYCALLKSLGRGRARQVTAPPWVDSNKGPHRVNRAHWPTKENMCRLCDFLLFRSMEKMAWDGPRWGWESLFLANPDLADILGRTDLDFENFDCFDLLDPKFLDFQVSRSPNFWISRPPDLQISGFPGPLLCNRFGVAPCFCMLRCLSLGACTAHS